ncbi:MAG TPA: VOC family protein [Ktedonobacterales bacterium]|nr:VOC family protein [Ktedonobacterales bacterium]
MVTGLEFVVLHVRDIAQARDFYTQKLGLTLAERTPGGRPQNTSDEAPPFLQFNRPGGHGATFALQLDADAQPITQLDLVWLVEDADAAHAELVSQGVEIASAPQDYPFGRQFVIKDPAGNSIYLLQPVRH